MQFFFLRFALNPQIPSETNIKEGRKFISEIQSIGGDVLVIGHGFLPSIANKTMHAHVVGLTDVLSGDSGSIKNQLEEEISTAIKKHNFSAIISDGDIGFPFEVARREYQISKELHFTGTTFFPVVGAPVRPRWVLIPKK